MKDDAGFDQDRMQCTTGQDGACAIALPRDQFPVSATYKVDANVAGQSGVNARLGPAAGLFAFGFMPAMPLAYDDLMLNPDGTNFRNFNDVFISTDGTNKTTDGGTTVVTKPDGATVVTRPDGTIIETSPDGTTVITKPDGTTVVTRPDGTIVVTKPGDGKTTDGGKTAGDGTIIETSPDGTTFITKPDGSVYIVRPDGKIEAVPEGTIIEKGVDKFGRSQLIITLPDGTKIRLFAN